MEIILSSTSGRPIYEQITLQIKEMIMKGDLAPGQALPSMRKLAKDLHVSVITTQRAYDDLQKKDLSFTVPAKGTFVSTENQDFIREENLRRIEQLLTCVTFLAKENRLSINEIKQTLEIVYTGGIASMKQALHIKISQKKYKDFTLDHILLIFLTV